MNRLQLCQRTAIECGVASNVAITSILPTVVGAAGSLGRVVNWVDEAWNDIQTYRDDWDWMRSSNLLGSGVSFVTVAGQASYPLGTGAGTVGVTAASFGKWDRTTFRNFTTAVGTSSENYLDEISFDLWRNGYMLGAQRTVQTRPYVVAFGPDQSVCLGPPPNALYTVTGDYFTAPAVMAVDTDTPTGLPAPFHMLIVYVAMVKYGGYEAAPDVYQRGATSSAAFYNRLQSLRAPRISFGGPLA